MTRNAGSKAAYRARTALALAYDRASRPEPAKLAVNLALRKQVEQDLEKRYSRQAALATVLVAVIVPVTMGHEPRTGSTTW